MKFIDFPDKQKTNLATARDILDFKPIETDIEPEYAILSSLGLWETMTIINRGDEVKYTHFVYGKYTKVIYL
jgi:hypothetical protein